MNSKIAVIIVNFNGRKLLYDCLGSTYNQTYPSYKIIMVDNGSIDGSVEFVKENFPKTKIIKLKINTGFAQGMNIGICEAFKDKAVKYICTLNNDTKAGQNFLEEMIRVIEFDQQIGSVQAKLLFPDGFIQSAGLLLKKDLFGPDASGISRGFWESGEKYNKPEEIFAPSPAAALYRREMLEEIGLFDEDFFAYAEDLDLGLRARLFGWKSYFAPQAQVIHFHSQTGKAASEFKAYHIRRNTNFTAIKNLPLGFLLKFIFLTPLNYIKLLFKSRNKDSSAGRLSSNIGFLGVMKVFARIHFDTIKFLPKMLKKRRQILKNKKISNKELKLLFKRFSK